MRSMQRRKKKSVWWGHVFIGKLSHSRLRANCIGYSVHARTSAGSKHGALVLKLSCLDRSNSSIRHSKDTVSMNIILTISSLVVPSHFSERHHQVNDHHGQCHETDSLICTVHLVLISKCQQSDLLNKDSVHVKHDTW